MALERPGIRLLRVDAHEVERLFPATIGGTRLETQFLHPLHEIRARHFVTAASRTATLVAIVADLGNDAAHVVVGYLLCGLFRRRIAARGFHHRGGHALLRPDRRGRRIGLVTATPGQGQRRNKRQYFLHLLLPGNYPPKSSSRKLIIACQERRSATLS